MQNIRTYFNNHKQSLAPSESDFEMLLSKIQIKQKTAPRTTRSPFMLWSFASVSFAALMLVVVSVAGPNAVNTDNKLAVNNSNEAINTIDSVKSFNIQNDNDF